MEIEPRHVFYVIFLSITLIILGGIGEGLLGTPNSNVVYALEHGDLGAKIGAVWDLFNANYGWMPVWMQWPFRAINWGMILLVARQLWKLVPVIGR